ncbi:hypothetical protein BJ912DRAFT_1052011 [Pholiota molesta]|nr:hypothetical protein BJ912DRAFT_1052011 [Pholiota molesta]
MSFLISLLKPLAYISLPVILVRQVAVSSGVGRYYARVMIYLGTMVTVASCSVFMAMGLTLLGRSTDTNYFVARTFYTIISRALDLHVRVEGEENLETRPSLLMVDAQANGHHGQKVLQFTPLGPFMTLSGAIFIDRGNSARAFRSIDAAGEKMKQERTSLWIFPRHPPPLAGARHAAPQEGRLPPRRQRGHPDHPHRLTVADVGMLSTRIRDQMVNTLREISPHAAKTTTAAAAASSSSTAIPASKPVSPSAGPIEAAAPLLEPSLGGATASLDTELEAKETGSSVASSISSSPVSERRKLSSSESGETEEEEGMVLVGRPI